NRRSALLDAPVKPPPTGLCSPRVLHVRFHVDDPCWYHRHRLCFQERPMNFRWPTWSRDRGVATLATMRPALGPVLQHLERSLLDLGGEFAFVARQRRLRTGKQWYRVDLMFFHRGPRCLVVI